MLEYNVEPSQEMILRWQGRSTDTGLFPQVKIYDSAGALIDTVNLAHVASGLYTGTWTNEASAGTKYYTQTIVYTGSYGGTASPVYRPDSDSINIDRFSSGGVFLGGGGKTRRFRLTKQEIEDIALVVKEKLMPELDKKSEFNPESDPVSINLSDLENSVIGNVKESQEKLAKQVGSVFTLLKNNSKESSQKLLKALKDIQSKSNETNIEMQKLLKRLGLDVNAFEQILEIVKKSGDLSEQTNKVIGEFTDGAKLMLSDEIQNKVAAALKDTVAGKELEGIQNNILLTQAMSTFFGNATMKSVRDAIAEGDANMVMQKLMSLPIDDRKVMYEEIVRNHPKLLKQLVLIQKNGKI